MPPIALFCRDLSIPTVICGNVGNIDTVMVQGNIVKQHGRLQRDDMALLTQRLISSSERIHARSEQFDLAAIRKSVSALFPINTKASLEQRFAGAVFNSPSKTLHNSLIQLLLKRASRP